jgi:hypothetical protein
MDILVAYLFGLGIGTWLGFKLGVAMSFWIIMLGLVALLMSSASSSSSTTVTATCFLSERPSPAAGAYETDNGAAVCVIEIADAEPI